MKQIPILMAEDDPQDQLLAKLAFRDAKLTNPLHCVENGQAVLDYLNRLSPYDNVSAYPMPGLIILDLNMPKLDGMSTLKKLKCDKRFKHIPVIILTTSNAESEVAEGYTLGAASYICKPVSFDALVKVLRQIGLYWFSIVEAPDAPKED